MMGINNIDMVYFLFFLGGSVLPSTLDHPPCGTRKLQKIKPGNGKSGGMRFFVTSICDIPLLSCIDDSILKMKVLHCKHHKQNHYLCQGHPHLHEPQLLFRVSNLVR